MLTGSSEMECSQYFDYYDLSVEVLADPNDVWLDAWGANGSQHAYTVIGSDGYVSWRRADGSGGNVDDFKEALLDAE